MPKRFVERYSGSVSATLPAALAAGSIHEDVTHRVGTSKERMDGEGKRREEAAGQQRQE